MLVLLADSVHPIPLWFGALHGGRPMRKMENGAGVSLALIAVVVGFVVVVSSILVAAYRIGFEPGPEMQWPTSLTVAGFAISFAGFVLGFFEWLGDGLRIKIRTATPATRRPPSPYIQNGRPWWSEPEEVAHRDLPPAA